MSYTENVLASILKLYQDHEDEQQQDNNNNQQSDLLMNDSGEFFFVNTADLLISFLQMWALIHYFYAWRKIAKREALDKYVSITFTCLAIATLSRLAGTSIKCFTNYVLWITSIKEENSMKNWAHENSTFINELIKSFSIISAFVRNIGLAFNLFRWFQVFLQKDQATTSEGIAYK